MNTVQKFSLEQMLQLRLGDEFNLAVQFSPKMAHPVLRKINIIHKYEVALFRPKSRNESKITSKLSTRMRRGELFQICSQSQIMFWIENM